MNKKKQEKQNHETNIYTLNLQNRHRSNSLFFKMNRRWRKYKHKINNIGKEKYQ